MTSKMENVVAKCPRISVRELARIMNTDYTSIHRILTKDLQMQKSVPFWFQQSCPRKTKRIGLSAVKGF